MATPRPSNGTQHELPPVRRLQSWITLGMILFFGILGVVTIWGYANTLDADAVTYILLIIAGAAFILGALVGFLFGIPRMIQRELGSQDDRNDDQAPTRLEEPRSYRANTNLEEISDWLTKILVGVGLTQLVLVPDALDKMAARMGAAMTGSESDQVFASGVVVYFAVCGFLFGYLWTRLFMLGALQRAEEEVRHMQGAIGTLQNKVETLEAQPRLDAEARQLILRHLDVENPPASPDKIEEAIRQASPMARMAMFSYARGTRKEGWQMGPREKITRSIPVFRALISVDDNNEFDRNHGELGFALKDLALVPEDPQRPEETLVQGTLAQWKEAEKELSTAIEIRDRLNKAKDSLGRAYEANRAVCRIKLYAMQPDLPDQHKAILRNGIIADLREAQAQDDEWVFEKDPWARDWMLEYDVVDDWLKKQKIDERNLRKGLPVTTPEPPPGGAT